MNAPRQNDTTHPDNNMEEQKSLATEQPLTLIEVMFSVFASAFGVQTSENRKRDFTRGNPIHFIVSGIVFTAVFVVLILMLVNSVISNAA